MLATLACNARCHQIPECPGPKTYQAGLRTQLAKLREPEAEGVRQAALRVTLLFRSHSSRVPSPPSSQVKLPSCT